MLFLVTSSRIIIAAVKYNLIITEVTMYNKPFTSQAQLNAYSLLER